MNTPLKGNEAMTRDEVLGAVSKAFGARAEAVVNYWNVRVETDPPCEVVFSADWVQMHAGAVKSVLKPADLENRLRRLGDDDWHLDKKTGSRFCLIR